MGVTPAFVAQREAKDCAVACIAMVAGIDYEIALTHVGFCYHRDTGMWSTHIPRILGEMGFAVRCLFEMVDRHWAAPLRRPTIVLLDGGHYVVFLPDGTVHDPARGPSRPLADYPKVTDVFEVHGVGA